MQVKDGLASLGPRVDNDPKAILADTLGLRQMLDGADHGSPEGRLGGLSGTEIGHVLTGHDQEVGGRGWIDVPKGHDLLILIEKGRWYLLIQDSAENAIRHRWHRPKQNILLRVEKSCTIREIQTGSGRVAKIDVAVASLAVTVTT